MTGTPTSSRTPQRRCAIYTRKSTEEGLDQAFNSLDAQREACEAFIKSQAHEGWGALPDAYDDGGFSGGNMDRPALVRLLEAMKQGQIDIILVYKVDRLSRSLADFVRIVELFDHHGVSFVSVTQQFNTSTSMGRLTLNVLLSFAQFEREVTSERIRDKIAASKKKGMWMGGIVPLGYDRIDKQLVVNIAEAKTVSHIYDRYFVLGCVRALKGELDSDGYSSKVRDATDPGGKSFSRGALYTILRNPLYAGKVRHRDKLYPGQHEAIIEGAIWQQVQDRLARNQLAKRTRVNSKNPSLLAGFVFDDRENVMSTTRTHKGSRRYRYYVSQALLQYREDEAGSVVRLPAAQLEELVVGQLQALLLDGPRLLSTRALAPLPAATQKALLKNAQDLATAWPNLPTSKQIELIQSWNPRITVARHEVAIELTINRILQTLSGDLSEDQHWKVDSPLKLTIPTNLQRSGIETRLVVSNGSAVIAHTASIDTLRKALQKALAWNEKLLSGEARTMAEIAKGEGVTQRFVAQRIQLAYLSPDIMKRIIEGDVPNTLTLESFKNQQIPLDWRKQRSFFQLAQ